MPTSKKELLRERGLPRIKYFQAVLTQAGIDSEITNEHSSNNTLDLPEFWPALAVVNESDLDKAREVIQKQKEENAKNVDQEIPCPSCDEKNPGNFELCWSCGAKLPSP